MLEKQMTRHSGDRSICAWFWEYVLSQGGDPSMILPVIASPTHYLFQVFRDGIIFLACTQVEMPPLMGIELLDEMMDNGVPLTAEPKIFREMIAPPNIVSKMLSVVTGKNSNVNTKLPNVASSSIPWRKTNTKWITQSLCQPCRGDGCNLLTGIDGEVQVNSHLPGLRDLALSFSNLSILSDIRFHPGVRFCPWESDQILSFVPPDEEFKLMSYKFLFCFGDALNKLLALVYPST